MPERQNLSFWGFFLHSWLRMTPEGTAVINMVIKPRPPEAANQTNVGLNGK